MDDSRRRALQTIAATGVGGLGATSGCLETVFGAGATRAVDETRALTIDDARSPSTMADRIEETIDTHGRYGFWGTAETTPGHGMNPIGGWDDETAGADGTLDTTSLLALYELPGRTTQGERHYLLWFWTGARPTGANDGPDVSRVETGVTLATDAFSMGQYAPVGAEDADGSVRVGLGIFDVETPQVEFPVDGAAVDVVPERTGVGDGGGFHLARTGETASAQSLLGTCEISGSRLDELELEWRTVVSVRS